MLVCCDCELQYGIPTAVAGGGTPELMFAPGCFARSLNAAGKITVSFREELLADFEAGQLAFLDNEQTLSFKLRQQGKPRLHCSVEIEFRPVRTAASGVIEEATILGLTLNALMAEMDSREMLMLGVAEDDEIDA